MHHAADLSYSKGSLIVKNLTSGDFRSISDLNNVETHKQVTSVQVANRPEVRLLTVTLPLLLQRLLIREELHVGQ